MLAFLSRHSSILLILAAISGFLTPQASTAIFPYLPYILFFLMLFTLLGIQQKTLIRLLCKKRIWRYGLFHTLMMTVLSCGLGYLLGASGDLLLAISGIAATGSLFATPAIARSVGLDVLEAMAMTITSTLLMPICLYINLMIFQEGSFTLDLDLYLQRLLIFIVCPMLFSAFVYHYTPHDLLQHIHSKISQITIVLVFAFPFGLISPFRTLFNDSLEKALTYLLIATTICVLYFLAGFISFRKQGSNAALLVAITSANRNVLLTFTVAGSALGPDFVLLLGALQLPSYALPILVRFLNRHLIPQPAN
ncbi:hypothetical protein L4D12_02545 [Photobacterium nomapromontoriensis]